MASVREIIQRRQSVSNISKITRTMEMISTARFKKAFDKASGPKAYSTEMNKLVHSLAQNGEVSHPLLQAHSTSDTIALLVMSSNRGLCGGYNGNVIRQAMTHYNELKKQGKKVHLLVSGKKAIQFFRFMKIPIAKEYTQFDIKADYTIVEELAEVLIELYTEKKIDQITVVHTCFESSAKFYTDTQTLLPFSVPTIKSNTETENNQPAHIDDYIFSPSPAEILNELVPAAVKGQLYQYFMDSVASEQVSRMRAMKAATDNGEQLIQGLSRQYNRVRQSAITSELLDILGGVEALK